jgi:hypothetical protein
MSYPGAAKVSLSSPRTVKVNVVRPKPIYSRAGVINLQAGVTEYNVEFPTPLPDAEYVVSSLSVNNYVDNRNLIPFIKAFAWGVKGANYFQVKLDTAPPTENFKLEWAIAEKYNP